MGILEYIPQIDSASCQQIKRANQLRLALILSYSLFRWGLLPTLEVSFNVFPAFIFYFDFIHFTDPRCHKPMIPILNDYGRVDMIIVTQIVY